MADLHIYRAPLQPATRWKMDVGGRPMWFKCKPRALRYCQNCGVRHYAMNMRVAAYYDCTMYFCKPGKGCKWAETKKAAMKMTRKEAEQHMAELQTRRQPGYRRVMASVALDKLLAARRALKRKRRKRIYGRQG